MGRSSVFTLGQIYRKQINSTWSKIPEVFRYVNSLASTSPVGTDYGYTAGGFRMGPPQTRQSTMDRLDFSSDTSTMSVRGSLNNSIQSVSSTSSQSFGYFAGGYYPSSFQQ